MAALCLGQCCAQGCTGLCCAQGHAMFWAVLPEVLSSGICCAHGCAVLMAMTTIILTYSRLCCGAIGCTVLKIVLCSGLFPCSDTSCAQGFVDQLENYYRCYEHSSLQFF